MDLRNSPSVQRLLPAVVPETQLYLTGPLTPGVDRGRRLVSRIPRPGGATLEWAGPGAEVSRGLDEAGSSRP